MTAERKATIRYWVFAAVTFIAVRVVTGSPILAMVCCTATCHFLARDLGRGQ